MTTITKGSKAPNFTAKDELGNPIQLSDYTGKVLVIYFYPKDNTPGCTQQACNLKENYDHLLKENIAILGVSADDEQAHVKFKTKFELPFPLIPDVNKELIQLFGVWGPKKFMGKEYDGIHRTTFIIDETGVILDVITKPKTKQHSEEILEILKHRK